MSTTNLIDKFGLLSAQIAELELRKKEVRDALIKNLGEGAHEGELFRVSISTSERSTLDMAAVRAKLTPQFIKAHTTVSDVTVVKATARNGILVKEAA